MVDNQTANKTNKHLKKRVKRKIHSWNSRISVLVVLVLLLKNSVLFVHCHLGRFEVGVWWCWSPPVVGSYLAGWLAEAPVDRGLEGP
jgi:hypothetical protein